MRNRRELHHSNRYARANQEPGSAFRKPPRTRFCLSISSYFFTFKNLDHKSRTIHIRGFISILFECSHLSGEDVIPDSHARIYLDSVRVLITLSARTLSPIHMRGFISIRFEGKRRSISFRSRRADRAAVRRPFRTCSRERARPGRSRDNRPIPTPKSTAPRR